MKNLSLLFLFLEAILIFPNLNCRKYKPLKMETDYTKEGMIPVQGTSLHYLQWGEGGKALLILHGLGDSPYIFSHLAREWSSRFKVIAFARRGHGRSGSPDSGYDNQMLTNDLKSLVDHLQLDRVFLLGWSMGGNEITEFAIRYPERTAGLIYLEAGYDYSEPAFASILDQFPEALSPGPADLVSLDAYRQWYHRFWYPDLAWNEVLEANLKACTRVLENGAVEIIPGEKITNLLVRSLTAYSRDYSKITAPVLALYTPVFFKHHSADLNLHKAYEDLENKIISPWRESNKEKLKKTLKEVHIHELSLGGHASVLFASQDSVLKLVNDFVAAH